MRQKALSKARAVLAAAWTRFGVANASFGVANASWSRSMMLRTLASASECPTMIFLARSESKY
ncbi:hypothetical protein DIPPA_16689 [Diplonema papillatum]|nr:hypothetical protein DIPPA_16689 [Diplonema papillatum]